MSTPFQNALNAFLRGEHCDNVPALKEKLDKGKDLSQEDIAKVISTSKQVVGKWLNGTNPSPEMLVRISKAFDVSIDWLLGVDDAISHTAQQGYEPFKDMGFSYTAYCNLLNLQKNNPKKYQEYMQALNIILEPKEEKVGFETDMITPTDVPYNSVLEHLSTYFREQYPSGDCWVTTTDPVYLVDMMEKQIKEHSDPTLHATTISAYHAVLQKMKPCNSDMYDAYVLGNLTQELKWLKERYYREQANTMNGLDSKE